MRTIENLDELIVNIKTLDKYLSSKTDPEYSFSLDLIKRGICFVALKDKGTYKFYPSRFIGYANNNMDAHLNNMYKDGKETNPVITAILGGKPLPNSELESLYCEYCEKLGITPQDRDRKFWDIVICD